MTRGGPVYNHTPRVHYNLRELPSGEGRLRCRSCNFALSIVIVLAYRRISNWAGWGCLMAARVPAAVRPAGAAACRAGRNVAGGRARYRR